MLYLHSSKRHTELATFTSWNVLEPEAELKEGLKMISSDASWHLCVNTDSCSQAHCSHRYLKLINLNAQKAIYVSRGFVYKNRHKQSGVIWCLNYLTDTINDEHLPVSFIFITKKKKKSAVSFLPPPSLIDRCTNEVHHKSNQALVQAWKHLPYHKNTTQHNIVQRSWCL